MFTSAALIALALSCGADKTEARLIDAIAFQESTRAKNGIHVQGDYNKKTKQYDAWGIYQFHRGRWSELGGKSKEYGNASAKTQTEVMLKAIRHCKAKAKKAGVTLTDEQLVIWVCRFHNIGNCNKKKMNIHTNYSKSVWKEYQRTKQIDK